MGVRTLPGRILIRPKFTWLLQIIGILLFGGLIAADWASNFRNLTLNVWALGGLLYLGWAVVIIVRPPRVVISNGELRIRKLLHEWRVPGTAVEAYELTESKNVLGGRAPGNTRHLYFIIYTEGTSKTVPAVWCDRSMGLLREREWRQIAEILATRPWTTNQTL